MGAWPSYLMLSSPAAFDAFAGPRARQLGNHEVTVEAGNRAFYLMTVLEGSGLSQSNMVIVLFKIPCHYLNMSLLPPSDPQRHVSSRIPYLMVSRDIRPPSHKTDCYLCAIPLIRGSSRYSFWVVEVIDRDALTDFRPYWALVEPWNFRHHV